MKKHLSHREWVRHQQLKNNLRDVLLHASFVEAIIISESIKKKALTSKEKRFYRTFDKALGILGKNKLVDICKLKEKRNKLAHRIVQDKLTQNQIEKIRDKMFLLLKKIYKNSATVKEVRKNEYGITEN